MAKKIFSAKGFLIFVLVTFILSSIYVVILRLMPEAMTDMGYNILARTDYELLLAYCLAGIAGLFVPGFVRKKFRYAISGPMLIMYAAFIFSSLFLGTLMNFYYIFYHWDTFLHLMSGITLGILGYALADIVGKVHKIKYNPMFVTVFAFCFAATMGMFWEIYEFAIDSILGTNTQRWADADGVPFAGQEALFDTMKDIIANNIGALAICIWGHMRIKGKGWPRYLSITQIKQ